MFFFSKNFILEGSGRELVVNSSFFLEPTCTAQKMKFSIRDFFRKWDQIRSLPRIWSHLLKKSLLENFIFCAVLKLGNITVSPEMIKKAVLSLDYTKTAGTFVHTSKVI